MITSANPVIFDPEPELVYRLRLLANALRLGRDGTFALLACDDLRQADGWLTVIKTYIQQELIVEEVTYDPDGLGIGDLFAVVTKGSAFIDQQKQKGLPLTVLALRGIEHLTSDQRNELAQSMNYMRSRLSTVAFPILVFVDEDMWDRLIHLAPDFYRYIGTRVDLLGFQPPTTALYKSSSPDGLEENYLHQLANRYGAIGITGVARSAKLIPVPLQDVYVLPDVLVENSADESLAPSSDQTSVPNSDTFLAELHPKFNHRITVIELIRKNRVIVLLGEPGAGKSTVLHYIAVSAAKHMLHVVGLSETNTTWVPIVVQFRDYQAVLRSRPGTELLAFIVESLQREYGFTDADNIVRLALATGRALLLFDGLDEVPDVLNRRATVQAIDSLLTTYPMTRAIVTSRIRGYTLAALSSAHRVATLCSFSLEQITEFLRRWYASFERYSGSTDDLAIRRGEEQARRFVEVLSKNQELGRLASNPLLLSIMALLYSQTSQLPAHRVEMYGRSAQVLIDEWNRARSLSNVSQRNLSSYRLVDELLGEVGLWIQEHGANNRITVQDLIHILTKAFRNAGNPDPYRASIDFLHDIQIYTGILVEWEPDAYGFMHLSFQQYFAAHHIAAFDNVSTRWNVLQPHVYDPEWREVILLTLAQLGLRVRERPALQQLVKQILHVTKEPHPGAVQLFKVGMIEALTKEQLQEIKESYLHRSLLLVGYILAEDVPIGIEVTDNVMERLYNLVYSKIPNQRYDVIDVLSRQLENQRSQLTSRLLQDLGDVNRETRGVAAEVLGTIAFPVTSAVNGLRKTFNNKTEDQIVRSVAAYAIGRLKPDVPDVSHDLLHTLQDGSEDWMVKSASASALGLLEITTSPLIHGLQLGLNDNAWAVRKEAAMALAAHGQKVPEAMEALQIALQRPDLPPKYAAALALATVPNPASIVLDILVSALNDQEAELSTRMDIAVGLEAIGVDDTRILEAFIVLMRDSNPVMRSSAARALGKLGIDQDRVIEALREAMYDGDWVVCKEAAIALAMLGQKASAAVAELHTALRQPNPIVQFASAAAITTARWTSLKPLDVLLRGLHDGNWSVRYTIANALGCLDTPPVEVVAPLINAVSDEHEAVRWAAAEAIGKLKIQGDEAEQALLRALEDNESVVRNAAYRALMGKN